MPTRVGVPDGVSRTPHLVNNVWTLSKADVIGDGGRSWSWESSRLAQSITIKILAHFSCSPKSNYNITYPSTSPSTFAKNLVSSIANVLRLSLRPSNSLTIIGADVIFVDRTLSPRSHTATPVA